MAKLILIVDDSLLIRTSVSQQLAASGGFTIETASDGIEAISKLEGGLKPDLMITDINMPNMNGIELITKTRMLTKFRFMPILVMTTESQQTLRDEAKTLGATGWVVKPVQAELLMNIIKKILPGV